VSVSVSVCRYIDCAQFYGNEKMVGDAIRGSGVPRSELFIASKVWGDKIYDGEEVSFKPYTLKKLKTLACFPQASFTRIQNTENPSPCALDTGYSHAARPDALRSRVRLSRPLSRPLAW
jgi:aryl-alcohol dehydrogenase-like predicted oxidoreductase